MELSMPERRAFMEHVTELIKGGILNSDDRDRILAVCAEACGREIRRMEGTENGTF